MEQQAATHDDLREMAKALARTNGILVAEALKLLAPEQLPTFASALPDLIQRVGRTSDTVGRLLGEAEIAVRAFVRSES